MLMYSFYLMKNVKDEDVKMYIYMHLAVMWLKLFHRRCNEGNFVQFYQTLHQVTIYYKSTHWLLNSILHSLV